MTALTFNVVDMPRWKERAIYLLLRTLGYGHCDWMLLEKVEDGEHA